MEITTEMYTKLFNELTNVQEDLERIIQRTKEIQAEVEKIYINAENKGIFKTVKSSNIQR